MKPTTPAPERQSSGAALTNPTTPGTIGFDIYLEKIATRMGVSTRELALPMKKLGAAKSIHTKGQKRATRYYPRGA